MGDEPLGWPSGEPPTQFQERTTYLTDWFVGAAKHALASAGDESTIASPSVMHRVSTVFFAAAAFDSCLNTIGDQLFQGSGGLGIMDHDGLLNPAFREIKRGRWKQKLGLYSFLWSAGTRWTLATDLPCLRAVEVLMNLRNRLIHAAPEKEELHGNRKTAEFHIHQRHHAAFGQGPGADLPPDLLESLSPRTLRTYVDAVEETIGRLQSLSTLSTEAQGPTTSFMAVSALDEDGSRPLRLEVDGQQGQQIRWCSVTRRYVVHTFTADAAASTFSIDETTRGCRQSSDCSKIGSCPWQSVRPITP